eukprot:TRINITY_DN19226_c0_g1_i5.p1 TRINITY_DN19226_c0_g1~~TRINITY_DN19226_c0_g1_i5.p1  ORF type:complete len:269 (-),score=57.83 TRINITY_DN19226_c0_g1_i5:457-1263(-)
MATATMVRPSPQPNQSSSSSHAIDSELSCISALLSLSSPRCVVRSRDSSVDADPPPRKVAKTFHSSAPSTPRGVTQPSLDPGCEAWVNRSVVLKRGKYEGRKALIVGVTTKKFRVRVQGVEHQLEFYPSMFKLSDPDPNPNHKPHGRTCPSSNPNPHPPAISGQNSTSAQHHEGQPVSEGEKDKPTQAGQVHRDTCEAGDQAAVTARAEDPRPPQLGALFLDHCHDQKKEAEVVDEELGVVAMDTDTGEMGTRSTPTSISLSELGSQR